MTHIHKLSHAGLLACLLMVSSTLFASPLPFAFKSEMTLPDDCFVQGFEMHEDAIYLSCGLYKVSRLLKLDWHGNIILEKKLDKQLFAEGLTIKADSVFLLSWKSRQLLEFSRHDLELLHTYPYPYEGWGISFNGKHFYTTDGSDTIYHINSKNKTLIDKRKALTRDNEKISQLNELEHINELLFANEWKTGNIHILLDSMPPVARIIHTINILPGDHIPDEVYRRGTMNGIAFDKKHHCLWITGKNWGKAYALSIDVDEKLAKLARSGFQCEIVTGPEDKSL